MSRTLYTLAYPTLTSADHNMIEVFRRSHDLPFRDVVAAHFTMVFGSQKFDERKYISHVKDVGIACKPITFVCRYAMLGVDDENDNGYVFLVPDEGYSDISLLHDRLYRGPLASGLRLDIPYVPHMTIGTLPTHHEAKALCDQLNSEGVSISGSLTSLSVCTLENNRIADLDCMDLAGDRN